MDVDDSELTSQAFSYLGYLVHAQELTGAEFMAQLGPAVAIDNAGLLARSCMQVEQVLEHSVPAGAVLLEVEVTVQCGAVVPAHLDLIALPPVDSAEPRHGIAIPFIELVDSCLKQFCGYQVGEGGVGLRHDAAPIS